MAKIVTALNTKREMEYLVHEDYLLPLSVFKRYLNYLCAQATKLLMNLLILRISFFLVINAGDGPLPRLGGICSQFL